MPGYVSLSRRPTKSDRQCHIDTRREQVDRALALTDEEIPPVADLPLGCVSLGFWASNFAPASVMIPGRLVARERAGLTFDIYVLVAAHAEIHGAQYRRRLQHSRGVPARLRR